MTDEQKSGLEKAIDLDRLTEEEKEKLKCSILQEMALNDFYKSCLFPPLSLNKKCDPGTGMDLRDLEDLKSKRKTKHRDYISGLTVEQKLKFLRTKINIPENVSPTQETLKTYENIYLTKFYEK